MIDPTRKYIIDLYDFFQQKPKSASYWIESSPYRHQQIEKSKRDFGALIDGGTACRLLFTVFMERSSEDKAIYQNLNSLLKDLKTSGPCAFFCEMIQNKLTIHFFIIQKTAQKVFYLYQSHPPVYDIFDSINRLDKDPLTLDDLACKLTHLGQLSGISYQQEYLKGLFHFTKNYPLPCLESTFSYFKCQHQDAKPFVPPQKISTIKYRITKFGTLIGLFILFYLVLRCFRSTNTTNTVLEIKLNTR